MKSAYIFTLKFIKKWGWVVTAMLTEELNSIFLSFLVFKEEILYKIPYKVP